MRRINEDDEDFICDVTAPCFQTLKPQEVELIRFSKTQVQFRKGDNLTKQGTFASYVLFVVDGLAVQYIENEDTKSHNLRILQPGDFIGLSSVFYNNTFNYSCAAITQCQAVLIEKAAITQLIGRNGVFGLSLMNRYMEQNSGVYDNLRTVLYKQMNGRLASALLYLNSLETDHPELFSLLSRKHIADFANLSTESTVKLLKAFEKDQLIQLNGKEITIMNRPGLEQLSEKG